MMTEESIEVCSHNFPIYEPDHEFFRLCQRCLYEEIMRLKKKVALLEGDIERLRRADS